MNKSTNGVIKKIDQSGKNSTWLKAAGAIALMGVGLILYRKRQRMIGSALITGSVKMLTGMAV